jgi:hypothetical protein
LLLSNQHLTLPSSRQRPPTRETPLAELITEGLYRDEHPSSCSFSISARYVDKFGQNKEFPALTWKFSQVQNEKVNWDKIDPRDFGEIAIDLKASPDAMAWMSDEPGMEDKKNSSDASGACDSGMLRANAIFIRATTYCRKNYMDSPAGYYALAMSRQCKNLAENELKAISLEAMKKVDAAARRYGRAGACRFVDEVEQQVLRAVIN